LFEDLHLRVHESVVALIGTYTL